MRPAWPLTAVNADREIGRADFERCKPPLDARHVTLEDKVRYLASATAHPGGGTPAVIETHMSWVFLAGNARAEAQEAGAYSRSWTFLRWRRASSIVAKKCASTALRPRRLRGRRSAVRAARWRAGDRPRGGSSRRQVVDWLVQMHRIPRERMLDVALSTGPYLPKTLSDWASGSRSSSSVRSRLQLAGPPTWSASSLRR